jgi:hypothetical protein
VPVPRVCSLSYARISLAKGVRRMNGRSTQEGGGDEAHIFWILARADHSGGRVPVRRLSLTPLQNKWQSRGSAHTIKGLQFIVLLV